MDTKRRKALLIATGVLASGGLVGATIPFIRSFGFAADKVPPTVDINIQKLKDGQFLSVSAFGRPLYVLKRSAKTLAGLELPNTDLADWDSSHSNQPEAATNPFRSLIPEVLVAWGQCTHLGCSVSYNAPGTNLQLGEAFERGAFYCPCHGSIYDLSGRVFRNMPAPRNLDIPEYEIIEDGIIRISHSTAY